MGFRKAWGASAVALAALLVSAGSASAATITADTFLDQSIDNADCSLREALRSAATNSNAHENDCEQGEAATDFVDLGVGFYEMTAGADDTNTLGDFDLNVPPGGGSLVINGTVNMDNVPTSIVDANDVDRIFDVRPGGTSNTFIQEVMLIDGSVPGGSQDGGAIRIEDDDAVFGLSTSRVGNNHAGRYGGGLSIDNAIAGVNVSISQTEFSDNTAGDDGGGLYVDVPQNNQLDVETSAFVGNSSGAMGGAAYIESGGTPGTEPVLTFVNSTLSGNSAAEGGGAVGFDFGLQGTVFFRLSTIFGNSSATAGTGGAIHTDNPDQYTLFQGGTIIAGNTSAGARLNCSGPGSIDSLGNNIEDGNTCQLTAGTDLINTNPLLAPLGYYAGGDLTTRTHALYDSSPALNKFAAVGMMCDGFTVDQRYAPRPAGGACDAGAYEGSLGAAPDTDMDGIVDPADNCPGASNASQLNTDGDLQGDACDTDDDNDTVLDTADNCPTVVGVPANSGCPAVAQPAPVTPARKCKKKKKKKKRSAAAAKKCKKKKKKKK